MMLCKHSDSNASMAGSSDMKQRDNELHHTVLEDVYVPAPLCNKVLNHISDADQVGFP